MLDLVGTEGLEKFFGDVELEVRLHDVVVVNEIGGELFVLVEHVLLEVAGHLHIHLGLRVIGLILNVLQDVLVQEHQEHLGPDLVVVLLHRCQ